MNKRVALVALAVVAVLSSVGLRGCWDPTKPDPWVSSSALQTTPHGVEAAAGG